MKVLVTGSEGYIGVWLAPLMLQRGHDVVGPREGVAQGPGRHRAPRLVAPRPRPEHGELDLEGGE